VRPGPSIAVAVSLLTLAGCGAQRSSLPPPPSKGSGYVPLARLARYPEVYSGASLSTVGTLYEPARGVYALRASRPIEVVPASAAARWLGRRVQVSGLLGVTFQSGYELTLGRIAAAPRA
jgi:hypothetical protein